MTSMEHKFLKEKQQLAGIEPVLSAIIFIVFA